MAMHLLFGGTRPVGEVESPGKWLWPGGRVEIPGKWPPWVGLGQMNRPLVVRPEFPFTHKGVCACVLGRGTGQRV